jgi:hypothetical protein
MREIEFKAKSLENQCVYGDLVQRRHNWGTFIEYTNKEEGKHYLTTIIPETICEYINYSDLEKQRLYTNDIIFYHRHEGWYVESIVVNKLGVITWDDKALGYRIKPIDTHSYKVNYGMDGEKIRTSHRIIKVGNVFDSNIEELVKQYLKK